MCSQESCKGIVDKYIEYDPVIVVIDLVLMSREAQRHIIYNTEFKVGRLSISSIPYLRSNVFEVRIFSSVLANGKFIKLLQCCGITYQLCVMDDFKMFNSL